MHLGYLFGGLGVVNIQLSSIDLIAFAGCSEPMQSLLDGFGPPELLEPAQASNSAQHVANTPRTRSPIESRLLEPELAGKHLHVGIVLAANRAFVF